MGQSAKAASLLTLLLVSFAIAYAVHLTLGNSALSPQSGRALAGAKVQPAGVALLLGDVNCDGAVDAVDAALIIQLDAGLLASPCQEGADVDGDGAINAVDAVLILQFAAGLIDTLPPSTSSPTDSPTATVTKPSVRITSTNLLVGDQGDVALQARDIATPGLGAWTIDITYDSSAISVKNCAPSGGVSVCNPGFSTDTIRVTGATASGLVGDTTLAVIRFTCDSAASAPLLLSLVVFADATVGDPQPIPANVENGKITCGAPTSTVTPVNTVPPTPTPPPTHTALPTPTPVDTPPPTAVPGAKGRMTGGGSVFGPAGARVTHGFELHCDPNAAPNRLEVNWEGNRFHLERLDNALCSDDPNIEPNPPNADFDTYTGSGVGGLNGLMGIPAQWIFTDAGEPGTNDTATITIFMPSGVFTVSNRLDQGDHQAQQGAGTKATATPTSTSTPTTTGTTAATPTTTTTPSLFPTPTPGTPGTPTVTQPATPTPTPTPLLPPAPDKPEIALNVKGGDCDDPTRPTKCNVPVGNAFLLSVDVLTAPDQGYVAFQTLIDYDDGDDHLSYKKAPAASEEIVWPDCASTIALRTQTLGESVTHACLTALTPPLPVSHFVGNALELSFNCSDTTSSTLVELIPGAGATLFIRPDSSQVIPNIRSLSINCVDPLIVFADSDEDGCTDTREHGADPRFGGGRDPRNPWDYFNPTGDRQNRVDDIIRVVAQFGVDLGTPGYTTATDRTLVGPMPWNLGPPNGEQRVDDVLAIVMQFGHDCV